jgi:hypothetical protein
MFEDFRPGAADLDDVIRHGARGEPLIALLERVADLDYAWGEGDGT